MPEAERKKLVAGLLAEEQSVGKPGGSDLKTLAKQVNTAYLKNLSMTKKRARSILTGKTSSTSVCSLTYSSWFYLDLSVYESNRDSQRVITNLTRQLDRSDFAS